MSNHFAMPPLSRSNKILLITLLAMFLMNSIFSLAGLGDLAGLLGLSFARFTNFHFHQLFTYALVPTQLIELIFDGMIFWFMGSELEYYWGNRRYVLNLVLWTLGAGLFFLLLSAVSGKAGLLIGPQTMVYGMLISYATLFPDRQLYLYFFPVKAKIFCWVMAGIQLYLGIFSGMLSAFAGLSAMGLGWLTVRFSLANLTQGLNIRPKAKSKSNLRLVKKDDTDPPKYWH
jgi:membrane associated rhomboid family serine protease